MVTTDESKLPPGAPVIIWDKDYNQAKADVEAKKLDGFLAFPADFTQKVEAGQNTNLEIVAQGRCHQYPHGPQRIGPGHCLQYRSRSSGD